MPWSFDDKVAPSSFAGSGGGLLGGEDANLKLEKG